MCLHMVCLQTPLTLALSPLFSPGFSLSLSLSLSPLLSRAGLPAFFHMGVHCAVLPLQIFFSPPCAVLPLQIFFSPPPIPFSFHGARSRAPLLLLLRRVVLLVVVVLFLPEAEALLLDLLLLLASSTSTAAAAGATTTTAKIGRSPSRASSRSSAKQPTLGCRRSSCCCTHPVCTVPLPLTLSSNPSGIFALFVSSPSLGKLSTTRNGDPAISRPRRSSSTAESARKVSLPKEQNATEPGAKRPSHSAQRGSSSSSPCGGSSGTMGPTRSTGLPYCASRYSTYGPSISAQVFITMASEAPSTSVTLSKTHGRPWKLVRPQGVRHLATQLLLTTAVSAATVLYCPVNALLTGSPGLALALAFLLFVRPNYKRDGRADSEGSCIQSNG